MNEISFQDKIVESLLPLGVEKIILFGSYSRGTQHDESDIDLFVVTRDEFTPSSFKEKMKVKLKIANALSFIRESYSLDLIVFTRPMYEKFVQLNSSFQREISSTGIILYERHHQGVA
jgi:predicted nucleotidyltransferase